MNKKGKFYVFVLCLSMIIILLGAYVKLANQYAQHNDLRVVENIGGKQREVLFAIREGERVQLYTQEAIRIAGGAERPMCGTLYLGHLLIGEGECNAQTATKDGFKRELNTLLAAYPGGSLADIAGQVQFVENNQETQAVIDTTKRIPVGTAAVFTGGTFSGSIQTWPSDWKIITSFYGKRNINAQVSRATTNHPGIDIPVPGNAPNQPVYSITDGVATFVDNGDFSYVQVQSGQLILRYMHVRSTTLRAGETKQVAVGEVIGKTIAFTGALDDANPHIHFETLISGVTENQVKLPSWTRHVGYSDDARPDTSYAIIGKSSGDIFLNPLCFFDRQYITERIEQSVREGQFREMPANAFESCEAYEQQFGISNWLAGAKKETTTPVATGGDGRAEATQARLEELGLIDDIEAAAHAEDITPQLLFAVITQESEGIADAVSPTGAVGLGQLTSGTAAGYKDIFSKITPCCTRPEANTFQCKEPAVRKCYAENDDRFNPEKNVRGAARRLKDAQANYEKYKQRDAFVLAAYNGGERPVNRAIEKIGRQGDEKFDITWPELKEALSTIEVSAFEPATEQKRGEVISYVERVLGYYQRYGGRSFAGTEYSTKQYGYYDVHIKTSTQVQSVFTPALKSIHDEVQKCTTEECIHRAVRNMAAQHGMYAELETLRDPQCLSKAEGNQAYLANQIATCAAAKDDTCTCPLQLPLDAEYTISAQEIAITELFGETVSSTPMRGLAYNNGGDSQPLTEVRWYDQAAIKETETSVKLDTQDNEPVFDIPKEQLKLYRPQQGTGMGFTGESLAQCIMPKEPIAYCMRSNQDSSKKIVFYISALGHTVPQDTITPSNTVLTNEESAGNEVASQESSPEVTEQNKPLREIVFSSDSVLPYIHASIQDGDKKNDVYMRVSDATGKSIEELTVLYNKQIADARAGRFVSLRYQTSYSLIIPLTGTESITLSFADENLRETQPVELNNEYVRARTRSIPAVCPENGCPYPYQGFSGGGDFRGGGAQTSFE
jgi:murein DD-endopeptidase MepM/ murein hydrolase activator NlpD/soluble lytic murein transglycosylase-like protein